MTLNDLSWTEGLEHGSARQFSTSRWQQTRQTLASILWTTLLPAIRNLFDHFGTLERREKLRTTRDHGRRRSCSQQVLDWDQEQATRLPNGAEAPAARDRHQQEGDFGSSGEYGSQAGMRATDRKADKGLHCIIWHGQVLNRRRQASKGDGSPQDGRCSAHSAVSIVSTPIDIHKDVRTR